MLTAAGHALADAAPPQTFPGSRVSATIKTGVRMAAEQVVLTLLPHRSEDRDDLFRWKVAVQADFQMKGGPRTEKMTVRFPLENPDGSSEVRIQDLKVQVGGKAAATRPLTSKAKNEQEVAWAGFDVTFPAGQVTHLRVTYSAFPLTPHFGPVLVPGYILETGAGWAGTIGQADVTLRLPYHASSSTVLADVGSYDYMLGDIRTTPGATFKGNEVRWTWRDLEPTARNNLNVVVLDPNLVRRLGDAQKAAKSGQTRDLLAWAKAATTLMVHDPAAVAAWDKDVYTAEYRKAVGALEARAARSEEARLAVLEAVTSLPNIERFAFWTDRHPELLRALPHLEDFRRKQDARVLPLFNQLQGRLDHTFVLPSQRAAQSQVTPEQTLATLTRAAGLTRYRPADTLTPRYGKSPLPCVASVTSLPAPQVMNRLDLALLALGRTWRYGPENPGRWYSTKAEKAEKFQAAGTTIYQNSFTSVNSRNEFVLFVWSGQLGGKPRTFMCVTKDEALWVG